MNISKILMSLFFISIFITSCSNSDDSGYYDIENLEVVFIDNNQSSYEVGDILWFNMNISSIQNEESTDKQIDIFNLTKATETFFGFSVFQIKDEDFSPLAFNQDNIIEEVGKLNVVFYEEPENTKLLGVATYNDGNYQLRIGIPLENSGNYFLANDGVGSGTQGLTFNTNNGKNIQVNFSTKIRNSDSDGRFYFTVN
jgi:hypothetical protein